MPKQRTAHPSDQAVADAAPRNVKPTPNVRGMYRITRGSVTPVEYETEVIDGKLTETKRIMNKGAYDRCAHCRRPARVEVGTVIIGRDQRAYICETCITTSDPNAIAVVVDALIAEKPYVEGEEDHSETDS